ncbi:T9SS type A sorting domain-containing protein [Psychroflexus tropicus]|uniref:T9SS type A sorting domain-containing protein n=1 Tax=Psychroflexus tropicus TaxID=197345 RepID=UPI00036FF830|nr:T9SS type A sorting domain-containing protein [Psychroflexus tropicus]
MARHLANEFVSTPVGDFNLPAAGGGSVTISDINNVFNSIGTRQLLANNINAIFELDNNAFDSFQSDLQTKGYPQQTRNIAISNGSHCANDQEIQALQELLYLSGDIEPTILLDTIINYFPLLSFVEGLGYVGLAIVLEDPAYLAGLLPDRTNLNAMFQAKSLPAVGQIGTIYKGRIRITKKINFILATLTYNINITDRNLPNPTEVQLPLDSYPGGAFNTPFDLTELNEIVGGDIDFLINLNVTARTANSFNFIPTISALDVGGGSTTLNNNDYTRFYTAANPPIGNKEIPFDNFTTSFDSSGLNETHISFNRRNGDWLAAELDENNEVFDCSFVCSDINITAPSLLCTSGTFSVTAGADSVIWSVSPSNSGVAISSGQGTNEATLTLTGGYSGQVTITANLISGDCGNVLSNPLVIWTGKPSTPNPIVGPSSVNTGALVNYQSGGSSGATSYEWWLPFPYETVTTFDYFGQNWQKLSGASSSPSIQVFTGYAGTSGNIQVMGRNSCGIGGARILSVNHGGGGGEIPVAPPGDDEEYKFIAYPNPSKNLLNINAIDTSKSNGIYTSVSGGLYNLNGKEVRSVKFYNDKSIIDTYGLKRGVYILKVYYDNTIETHQIIVE